MVVYHPIWGEFFHIAPSVTEAITTLTRIKHLLEMNECIISG